MDEIPTKKELTLYETAKEVALNNGFGVLDASVFAEFWKRRFTSWDRNYMQQWINRIKSGTMMIYADSDSRKAYAQAMMMYT
jgi:hypothetical protein